MLMTKAWSAISSWTGSRWPRPQGSLGVRGLRGARNLRSVLTLRLAAPRNAPPTFTLVDGALLSIQGGQGTCVAVVHGRLLISETAQLREVDLIAGSRYPLQSDGRVLIEAIGPAEIAIHGAGKIVLETRA